MQVWCAHAVQRLGRWPCYALYLYKYKYKCAARLVRQLLHPDFTCRPTVQEVLEHEFLIGA